MTRVQLLMIVGLLFVLSKPQQASADPNTSETIKMIVMDATASMNADHCRIACGGNPEAFGIPCPTGFTCDDGGTPQDPTDDYCDPGNGGELMDRFYCAQRAAEQSGLFPVQVDNNWYGLYLLAGTLSAPYVFQIPDGSGGTMDSYFTNNRADVVEAIRSYTHQWELTPMADVMCHALELALEHADDDTPGSPEDTVYVEMFTDGIEINSDRERCGDFDAYNDNGQLFTLDAQEIYGTGGTKTVTDEYTWVPLQSVFPAGGDGRYFQDLKWSPMSRPKNKRVKVVSSSENKE